jgi:choline dehydrogenase-like flavoprotein
MGHREPWLRGSVLGGSTAVNGMMYIRGQATDFDSLERRGNPGWGWQQFLRAYMAIEDHSLGGPNTHGTGGPLGVSVQTGTDDETMKLLIASARNAGWPFVGDVNAEDAQHIGFTPATIKNGVRQSTANAFLWPIRDRANLTIATKTTVDLLRFDGRRVIGVTARHGDHRVEYTARKEVILSAGTIETPMILERSGIGRADVLAKAGVALRVESPHVGKRVIEQRGVIVQVRFRREIGHTMILSSRTKQLLQGARYLLTRKGPLATCGHDLVAHIKSRREIDRPDIQIIVVPFALDLSGGLNVANYPGMTFFGYQMRPKTQSSVQITTNKPGAPPKINANNDNHRNYVQTILRAILSSQFVAQRNLTLRLWNAIARDVAPNLVQKIRVAITIED